MRGHSIHGDRVVRVQYLLLRRRWEQDWFLVDVKHSYVKGSPNGTVSKAEAIRMVEEYEVEAHESNYLKETKPKHAELIYTYKCRHAGNVYTDLPIDSELGVGDFGWHYTAKCDGTYQHEYENKVCHSCKRAIEEGNRLLTSQELYDLNNTGWLK